MPRRRPKVFDFHCFAAAAGFAAVVMLCVLLLRSPAWAMPAKEATAASTVVATPVRQPVDANALTLAAMAVLEDWLRDRSDFFRLMHWNDPMESACLVGAGEVAMRARPLPEGTRLSPRMRVWVDIAVDGKPTRTVPVFFKVEAYRQVWIAQQDMAVGQPLVPDAFEHKQIDIAAEGVDPLADLPSLRRLRKPLLAGHVLAAAHVESVPTIARGDQVTLRTQHGQIAVEAQAEALQDGQPGQQVLVRIAQARSPVVARVVGAGVVELTQ
jgi:flagella basal body P-ring formation protein FlgA